MKNRIVPLGRGLLTLGLGCINTIFWFIPILFVGAIKKCLPLGNMRGKCNMVLQKLCALWASTNKLNIDLLLKINLELVIPEGLSINRWYLVICNHQSWVDILMLQYTLNTRIPYLCFFLKKELRWIPVLNIAWWLLDYPYMTRYSKNFLAKHPNLKGKDLEITKKACRRLHHNPVAIMNFVEGTRFRQKKHKKQKSPYRHLLLPKAGGIAFVLGAMKERLHSIIDVTIAYPEGSKEIWQFLQGNVKEIRVHIREVPITNDICGDYINDAEFKQVFHKWLNQLWLEKNQLLDKMLTPKSKDDELH